jgi:hypothetical protein
MATILDEPKTEIPIEVQILERAALILEEFGHCTGALYANGEQETDVDWEIDRPGNRYCEIGAIWRAGWERGLLPRYWNELFEERFENRQPNVYVTICSVVGIHDEIEVAKIYGHNDSLARSARSAAAHLRSLALERL